MSSIFIRTAAVAALISMPALGLADIVVSDPYARVSRPNAPTGAAFMIIQNTGDSADRLVAASSTVAKRVELHTHIDQGDGIMKMTEIEGGIVIAAGESHVMARGGDHVMFMGLTKTLDQGGTVEVTLSFENAGDITISVPVDNERKPDHGAMGHGSMQHNAGN